MSNENKPKDPCVGFTGGSIGENSKGKARVILYLKNTERARDLDNMIEYLTSLKDSSTGAKLDIGVTDRINTRTNRPFESYFCYIKEIEQKDGFGGYQKPSSVAAEEQNAAIEALKSKQV